jgi:hypothetical protein
MLYSSIYFCLTHHHAFLNEGSLLQIEQVDLGGSMSASSVSLASPCFKFVKFVLILFCSLLKYLLLMPELRCIQFSLS